MRSNLLHRLNLDTAGKTHLWAPGLVLLAFSLFAGIIWIVSGNQAHAHASLMVDAALDDFSLDQQLKQSDLQALGTWLSQRQQLTHMLRSHDSLAIAKYYEPLLKTNAVDFLAITDDNGNILWAADERQPSPSGSRVLDQAGVNQALQGHTTETIVGDEFGLLQRRLFLPVYGAENQATIGTLTVGYRIDNSFKTRKTSEVQMALVTSGRIVTSSMTDKDGKPWGQQPAPAQVLQAARTGLPTGFFTLQTEDGDYIFKFNPLWGPGHMIVGFYGAGVPLDATDDQRLFFLGILGLGLVTALLGMLAVGLAFSRTYKSCTQTMRAALEGMVMGNLSTRIESPPTGALAALTHQLDSLRAQWLESRERARFEQGYLTSVVQIVDVAIITTDHSQRVSSVNRAAELILHQERSDLLGQKWTSIFEMHDPRDQSLSPSWNLPPAGREASLAVHGRFPLHAYSQIILDVVSSAILVSGQPAGYVHVIRDASEQAHFEHMSDELIVNIAHELRAPLASLQAHIDLLVEDHLMMSRHDLGVMLRTLQKVNIKFQGLVESLIDIGSLQAGRFRVRPIPTAIGPLVQDAVDQTEPLLEAKGQKLESTIQDPNLLVLADRPRIMQVVVNLLNNASKYGPEDSRITLSTWSEDGLVVVGVKDQGPGIPLDEQSAIFARFFRGKRVEREGSGIGVGLALAKGIVEAHGGYMHLSSSPEEGTTFSFGLPKADATEDSRAIG